MTDYRLPSDSRADDHSSQINPGSNLQHVLEFYKPARMALSPSMWNRCPRIALFDPHDEPKPAERKAARIQLLKAIARIKPQVIAVIPNEVGSETTRGSSVCWQVFGTPDNPANMRGTFYRWEDADVIPLHAPSAWAKQLQHWQQDRFIKRALAVAEGREKLLSCQNKVITPDREMADALGSMESYKLELAVDIESIESCDKVTAIGISDGVIAISVPWHSFKPIAMDREPGIKEYGEVGEVIERRLRNLIKQAPKTFFHNYTFDVPRLKQEGFEFPGEIHDTMAAHAIAFPELRHGLQHACADMLPIRPWKSIWHPKQKGLTRDDEDFWTCDPIALRDYNADDAFHTHHLAQAVMPCVEV